MEISLTPVETSQALSEHSEESVEIQVIKRPSRAKPKPEEVKPVVATPKPRAKPKAKYLEVPPPPIIEEPPSEPVKMKSPFVSCPNCHKQMPAKSLKYYHALKCTTPADPTPTQQPAPVSTTVFLIGEMSTETKPKPNTIN